MVDARYSGDKPGDCSNCFFWDEDRSGCRLGRMNCYYLLERPRVVPTPCDGCPYKKAAPCIGWCTKRILGQEGVNMYTNGYIWRIYSNSWNVSRRKVTEMENKSFIDTRGKSTRAKIATKEINDWLNSYSLDDLVFEECILKDLCCEVHE